MQGNRLQVLIPWAVLGLAVATYGILYVPSVPGPGPYALDYMLHLPNLLAGFFHFLANGPLSAPWFTPAQCGGVPFLADLNVAYYSLPQWLAFAVGPILAIEATFVGFAAAGAVGTYLLGRSRFGLSAPAALTAAILFLRNGFYLQRMAIGHITFHPFMLTPWLAWLVLPAAGQAAARWPWPRLVAVVVAVALIFAYAFEAGMVHLIVPMALAAAVVVLIQGYLFGGAWRPWLLLGGGSVLAMALSAQRLAAAWAFAENFPRSLYPLAGFENPLLLVWVALQSVFWKTPGDEAISNALWKFEPHEWRYSVGPAAAILLLAGLGALIWRRNRGAGGTRQTTRAFVFLVPVAAILVLPLLLNFYSPTWNGLLKDIPVIGSSVTLLRWYALYAPIIALACGLAIDAVAQRMAARWAMLAVVAIATVVWNLAGDPLYRPTPYNGRPVVELWKSVRTANDIPPISQIVADLDRNGRVTMQANRNNAMVFGRSQLACYDPTFGYLLENFPLKRMRPGMILETTSAGFNIKNPACYLFPDENGCQPGDHFQENQLDAVIEFAQYREFPFQVSRSQEVANAVGLVALAGTAIALGAAAVGAWRRRGRGESRRS